MTENDFECIVLEHQSMVYSIAYNFFHNRAWAEEVAQDVFLQLYETQNTMNSRAHLVSCLRRTTTHRCIDVLRHRGTWNEVLMGELPDVPDNYPASDPFLQQRLQRLVASLPERPRAIIILRYGEDMEVEEISRVLKMPVRTVWSHLQ